MRGAIALWVSLALHFAAMAENPSLEARITPLAKAHKGTVAVAVKHLKTGESFYLNADESLPTASLIKLPIMIETHFQISEKKITPTEMVTLKKEDMVPGSGILTEHFSPGAQFSLRDAVRLMIVFSDNTATNLVLDRVGLREVNARMAGLKLPNTRVHAKVFKASTTSIDPERSKTFGLGSTTAREMVSLLEMLNNGELVSPVACQEMLVHLGKCDDKEKFPRLLPKGVTVAHKTGSVSDARTDAGILSFKGGPVALCVLTAKNDDKRWTPDNAGNKLCAEIAREVVSYFQK